MGPTTRAVQDLTPNKISEMLQNCGELRHGEVTSFTIDRLVETDISVTAALDLSYSAEVSKTPPNRLFLKVAECSGPKKALEVDFYQSVGPSLQDDILLTCYGVNASMDSGVYCLLLEDVSNTHVLDPKLDDIEWCKSEYDPFVAEQVVDGFARIHSLFWGDQGLEMSSHSYNDLLVDEDMIRAESTFTTSEVSAFLDVFGTRLGTKFSNIFRKVSEVYPDLIVDRVLNGGHLTLTHRDSHAANVLVPQDPSKDRPVVVDWATCARAVGVHDLATHIPPYWHRTVRNAMEEGLLRRYHAKLCAYGVNGYSWDQCWYDYRLGVMGCLNNRIRHSPFDSAVGLWICDNCINAFVDLDCEDLIPA